MAKVKAFIQNGEIIRTSTRWQNRQNLYEMVRSENLYEMVKSLTSKNNLT